jgi:hypothetical protein
LEHAVLQLLYIKYILDYCPSDKDDRPPAKAAIPFAYLEHPDFDIASGHNNYGEPLEYSDMQLSDDESEDQDYNDGMELDDDPFPDVIMSENELTIVPKGLCFAFIYY